ncbi:MAG: YeeE/YedE thiosulfate transporter family protein, partial [Alphaproteobacteria bacterium]
VLEWRPVWRLPLRQVLSAIGGGLLIGLAARMAPSCNVWHLWGGVPILALPSLLFVAGLLPGAWLGAHLLQRFVIR